MITSRRLFLGFSTFAALFGTLRRPAPGRQPEISGNEWGEEAQVLTIVTGPIRRNQDLEARS